MKAAVINNFGEVPGYIDFQNPEPEAEQILIKVKAAVLENFDKGTASGKHYSSHQLFPSFPAIVGSDGVGETPDGRLVIFRDIKPPYGAYAEQAIASQIIEVPGNIDAAKATAIPSAALTSLLPLKYSAKLQAGETVLINGATGVSGRIAVQIAKLLGAGRIIATGRNKESLKVVQQLGADVIIDLNQDKDLLTQAFKEAAPDVVLDFIWGTAAELLVKSFIPTEAGFAKKTIRYVQIGTKAGLDISLPGTALRTSGLQLMGIGQIAPEALMTELNCIWNWILEDKLYMEIEEVPLSKIAEAWQREDLAGKRLVIVP
ncbi:zinc-binding alcohol dehydrogenase family protein [Chitinophaga silvatica]|uniref:Zinc-binding alcohol dehydrogenase family protein n=1 Tax=Chitinophaga silvatica TaxID=2282649 RepID=A0A3E1YAX0_9BACT|nr:zinc-binding alcohol dehydrogenase family protein [Chitinophaga silvatica]RFS22786.1 zinc-binding alcohol dehydrogenase family protein [Chitinophaga silvatica]